MLLYSFLFYCYDFVKVTFVFIRNGSPVVHAQTPLSLNYCVMFLLLSIKCPIGPHPQFEPLS